MDPLEAKIDAWGGALRAALFGGRSAGTTNLMSMMAEAARDQSQDIRLVRPAAPKPPTLHEWLGDRVAELGPWADVLREQPVPAGWIESWRWKGSCRVWVAEGCDESQWAVGADEVVAAALGDGIKRRGADAWQMALFTRHPDVKPDPRKPTLRTWFGNEEEA